MKNKLLINVFFFFIGVFWVAGQDSKIIRGALVADSAEVVSIHVLNKSLGRFTITDEKGTFAIRARVNDTLIFSSVQFQREQIRITSEIFEKGTVNIQLKVQVNELDEVVLRPYNLTGDLYTDLKNIDQDNMITETGLGLPNQYVKEKTQTERRIYEAKTGGGIIPLNPILNAISGRTKRLKNQLKLERQVSQQLAVMNTYERRVYSETFNIPDDYIEGFIIYCAQDPEFEAIRKASDALSMLEYLKIKSQQYNKEGVLMSE